MIKQDVLNQFDISGKVALVIGAAGSAALWALRPLLQQGQR